MNTVITSIITSGAVAIISGLITYTIQERKLNVEKERISNLFKLEKEKLAEQYKTERRADEALSEFLNHVKFTRRSFNYIREKLGGFEDDELRRMLIRNGAIRSFDKNDKEWWELREKYELESEELFDSKRK